MPESSDTRVFESLEALRSERADIMAQLATLTAELAHVKAGVDDLRRGETEAVKARVARIEKIEQEIATLSTATIKLGSQIEDTARSVDEIRKRAGATEDMVKATIIKAGLGGVLVLIGWALIQFFGIIPPI